jgi:N-acetylmuramoyl-L-alanine amidase
MAVMTIASFTSPNVVISEEANTGVLSCNTAEDYSSGLYLHNRRVEPSEIELLSVLVMAEAEDEPDEGKRLVIDTVFNRVESDSFPDTIYEVIFQKNQFTSVWNGRLDRCSIDSHCCELIIEELRSRTNYDCIFFNADHYSAYGTPMFSVGNHYFSKGDD